MLVLLAVGLWLSGCAVYEPYGYDNDYYGYSGNNHDTGYDNGSYRSHVGVSLGYSGYVPDAYYYPYTSLDLFYGGGYGHSSGFSVAYSTPYLGYGISHYVPYRYNHYRHRSYRSGLYAYSRGYRSGYRHSRYDNHYRGSNYRNRSYRSNHRRGRHDDYNRRGAYGNVRHTDRNSYRRGRNDHQKFSDRTNYRLHNDKNRNHRRSRGDGYNNIDLGQQYRDSFYQRNGFHLKDSSSGHRSGRSDRSDRPANQNRSRRQVQQSQAPRNRGRNNAVSPPTRNAPPRSQNPRSQNGGNRQANRSPRQPPKQNRQQQQRRPEKQGRHQAERNQSKHEERHRD